MAERGHGPPAGARILAERILAFQDRYNAAATPFGWRFTRHDLSRLLRRIDAHRPAVPALAA